LPKTDPFSYTIGHLDNSRIKFFMTSYWLSQTIYYGFYSFGGFWGVIFMRFVLALIVIVLLYRLGKQYDKTALFSIILLVMLVFLKTYFLERPQVFSFIFFAFLLYQLKYIASDQHYSHVNIFLLPLVMLIWSNMHAGYIVGQLVIVLYLFIEGIRFISPSLKPIGILSYKRFLISGGAALLASLGNPNTYRAWIEYLNIEVYTKSTIAENQSTINTFLNAYTPQIPVFWALLLAATAITVYKIIIRRTNVTEVVLFVAIGYLSFMNLRYIAFALILLVPLLAEFVDSVRTKGIVKIAVFSISLGTFVYFITLPGELNTLENIRNLKSDQLISTYNPQDAVAFIRQARLQGNMYNYYDWGGYLIWALPEKKVFIDSRGFLYGPIYLQTIYINEGLMDPEGTNLPYYKTAFTMNKVLFVITPLYDVRGHIIPLVMKLLMDDEWTPVFLHGNSTIFTKITPENYGVIYLYNIPRDDFVKGMMELIDDMIKTTQRPFYLYITKGDLYRFTGQFEEAKDAYQKSLELFPFNPAAKKRLQSLKRNEVNN
ncbi:MAG TPA: tetratricopeptide repeat protein, partial [Nitrospirota bacterium]|nr:tetratricopeptide repeat protein [Nitrospirota bacterium]